MGVLARALAVSSLLSAASLTAGIPAAPRLGVSHTARDEQEPCAQVAAEQEQQIAADSKATSFNITAQLGHDCLTSLPFKSDDALRIIDGLSAFWQWQSTVDYLIDPPETYMMPATDIFSWLTDIRDKASADEYENEFEFQSELRDLAVSVHDGHFNLQMDALEIFTFSRDQIGPIVSVSADGEALPEIYTLYDLQNTPANDSSWEASPITMIDNMDAYEWLSEISYQGTSLDPDALYNELFYTPAIQVEGLLGNFYSHDGEYTGPTTTLTFANETTTEYQNSATFKLSFEGITDGDALYTKYCNGKLPKGLGAPGTGTTSTTPKRDLTTRNEKFVKRASSGSARAGYPESVVELKSGHVAGYFLDDDEETAVLSITGFMSDEPEDFAEAITTFLTQCTENGKTKLIVDVTGNGGGAIFLGYDVFKQLFPDTPINDAANLRATEQLWIIGSAVNQLLDNNSSSNSTEATKFRGGLFDIQAYTSLEDEVYNDWEELFGPSTTDQGYFTNDVRWNFEDETTSVKSGGLIVSGFLDKSDLPPPVFEPENMVLLTDAICGSTCNIFGNLLTTNGVQSIVTGGRPQDGPVQAMGGVRGTNVLPFASIYAAATDVMNIATTSQKEQLNGTEVGMIANDGDYVLARSQGDGLGARVNVRNGIDPEDPQRIPRQFAYHQADCRIWPTAEMVLEPQKMWSAVANTAFGDGECTPGSTSS